MLFKAGIPQTEELGDLACIARVSFAGQTQNQCLGQPHQVKQSVFPLFYSGHPYNRGRTCEVLWKQLISNRNIIRTRSYLNLKLIIVN